MGSWTTKTRFWKTEHFNFLYYYFNFIVWICADLELCVGNPNMVMALAGNKADLEDKRKVAADVSCFSIYLVV